MIDTFLREAAAAPIVPGVVAMATTGTDLLYESAFGLRDLGKGEAPGNAMTPDTIFWIASMTKAVTSLAAMQMVEQGRLELDAPVASLLPQLAQPNVLVGFSDDGMPLLRPARGVITLRHLLTHTAGFGYPQWNELALRYMKWADLPLPDSGEEKALAFPLIADPGVEWEYGINTDFLGRVVEVASGERIDRYFQAHIFEPLGMSDTMFILGAGQRARHSTVHARQDDGSLVVADFELEQQPEIFSGGGGLYSTARDYIAFIRMLLNGGRLNGAQVIEAGTIALMAQNHLGDLVMRALPAANPVINHALNFYPDQDKKWGLGFMINTQPTAEGRSAGSLAWAGISNCYYWVDRSKNVGGVIMHQFLPFADRQALELFARFEKAIYDSLGAARGAHDRA